MGIGGPTPTTFATGYLYAGMGYTTVVEAAVPIMSAKHTHEELRDTPIVDKACCLLMANNELMMDLLEAGDYERAKDVVAWMISAAKVYGVKAVNPGGVTAWKWGKDAKQMHEPVTGYNNVTPGTIVTSLSRMCDELGLPHPMHLHCNNLGTPGNIDTTLETMKLLEGNRAHMAHLQFHSYGGDDWHSMRSEAVRLAEYFNAHPNLTCDAGAVLFGNAVTITADGPWQHLLYQLTGRKWGNLDVENETGCGIVPYTYKGSNLVNAVQWAVGLELLLLITDPWRIFLTTDHPNGACFWRYPEIIHMLMHADFRKEQVRKLPEAALSRIVLADLDREYSLYEIAIITSAGPARALGMKNKGHLGVGADADVAIYNDKLDGEPLFRYPRFVIKAGELAVEEGDIRSIHDGHEFVVTPTYNADIEDYLKERFEDHYTMRIENYPVDADRVHGMQMAECSYGNPTR
jgi:formylmethanofuran dehydrogenase subunit A